jgi:hypothetical protein
MPPIMQKGFTLSLGMAFKSFEMVKSPQATWSKMTGELKQMVTIPEDAGDGVQAKAKALAAVWMEKGMTAVEACRAAGRKFTGDE